MILKIYTASAGSGKTHTIVSEYLKIALEDPENFGRTLAVTFTNKVAAEMKHRILHTVYEIANARLGSAGNIILKDSGWTVEELVARARKVFKNILHNYSRFSVCTIDSFFQKTITAFSNELALPQDFELVLNPSERVDGIIDAVLRQMGSDAILKSWILKISSERALQGKSWAPTEPMLSLCQELFTERGAGLLGCGVTPEAVQVFMDRLDGVVSSFEERLKNLGSEAMSLFEKHGLAVENFLYGGAGVAGFLEKISRKEILDPGKRVLAAAEVSANWHTKTSANRSRIVEAVDQGGCMDLLRTALFFYEKHKTLYKSAKAAKKNIHMLGIGAHFAREISGLKKNENLALLSDAARMVHTVCKKITPKDFFTHLGLGGDSVFIDEFQDISDLQWQCFRPLIGGGILEGHPSLVVGDVKQAIYRWRNSDWRLLHRQIFEDVESNSLQRLDTNWRSEKEVVLFNNTFFRAAARLLHQSLDATLDEIDDVRLRNELRLEARSILAIYEGAAQRTPIREVADASSGYVRVQLMEEGDEGDMAKKKVEDELAEDFPQEKTTTEMATEAVVTLIENLQEEGFAAKDVAVLVRNHKEAATISAAMQSRAASTKARLGCVYDVASSSSFCLGHNCWVNLAIAAMKFAECPEDKLALYELKFFHNLCAQERRDANTRPCANTLAELCPELNDETLEQIAGLSQLPLSVVLSQIENIFGMNSVDARVFLEKLGDLVLEFSRKNSAEPALKSFLTWWQDHGTHKTLPVTEGVNAIRILTIHQSKGLQFPVVILPFCDWGLDHGPLHAPLLWCEGANLGPFAAPGGAALPIAYSPELRETFFAAAYYRERTRVCIDNFNLLYVACTRPQARLYIFAKKSQREDLRSVGDLVCATLAEKNLFSEQDFFGTWENFWTDGGKFLEIGEKKKFRAPGSQLSLGRALGSSSQHMDPSLRWGGSRATHGSQLSLGRAHFFEKEIFLEKKNPRATLGEILHDLLAQINFLEDVPKILGKVETMSLGQSDRDYLLRAIGSLFGHERVLGWFQNDWRHRVEATFITRDGKVLRADRVLEREGVCVVLDFKTGVPSSAHPKQVREYMDCLFQMGHAQVQGILLYLGGDEVEVVEVEGVSVIPAEAGI